MSRELADRLAALSPAKRALLEQALARQAAAPSPADAPIRPLDGDTAPLSFEQRRLWFVHRLSPGTAAYTVPFAYRLRGPLDAAALEGCLAELVRRHAALRTAFEDGASGEAVQRVHPDARFALETLDLRPVPAAEREAEARRAMTAFVRRPFALDRGPLFRALLVRLDDDEHVLTQSMHHLVADGSSQALMLAELSTLYTARVRGAAANLPPPPAQFPDFAAWQREHLTDEALAAELDYWRGVLDGAPHGLELPPDGPRPAAPSLAGAKEVLRVPAAVADALRALGRREGASLFTVLLSVFAALLHRCTGEADFLVGTVTAGRARSETERMVGFFANTLPLRVRLEGDPTTSELIGRLHPVVLGAHDHARLPFDRIVELAGVRRDATRAPLVQVMFLLNDAPGAALRLPGVSSRPELVDAGASPFDLTLSLEERPDGLHGELQYATDLYLPESAALLARRYERALSAIASNPHTPVSRLPLVGDDERRIALEWGRAEPHPPDDSTLHRLFEIQARETPDAVALVFGETEINYADLNADANRIAHRLRRLGVGPEARVGVCMERTPALVAALLGVLKAGGAYVPLDPAYPPARLEHMLRASGARVALADAASRPRLEGLALEIDIVAADSADLADEEAANPATAVDPRNLAYVIFTSGSTGGPKGVGIEHRSTAALLRWLWSVLPGEERAAVLGSSSVSFDFSIAEIFGTLCGGGTLVLVDNPLSPVPRPVRAVCLVPTVAAELLRQGRIPPGVRTVMLGGETVSPALARGLHASEGVERVINTYGPTEDTTCSTWADLDADAGHVPIGRPIAGGRVYVLDAHREPAGVGVPGELYVAGAGVARGYAGRPALTAERFVPDPVGPPGARMYRTGDLARWRADGALEFLGRRDGQMKVRGVRVEAGEIEAALAAHPAVREAAVALRPGGPGGEPLLAAWLVPADGQARPDAAELRATLRAALPEAMVPSAFAWVADLPRTGSGKLDRRALPRVAEEDAPAPTLRRVGPRSALEEQLAALWAQVLGVERVGIHDDFFDLGGQSLLALRLVARIRDELGRDLPVATLFRAPTVEAMAREVAGGLTEIRLPLVPLQPLGTRPALFLAPPGGGHLVCYRTLTALLAPDQPVYGLQSRGLDDGLAPLASVEEMAAFFLDAMRAFQPRGPYRLGGWSLGGVLAFEMARQFEAAGEPVGLLALLDTGVPTSESESRQTLDHARVLVRILGDLLGFGAAALVRPNEIRNLPPREQLRAALEQIAPREPLPPSRHDEILALTRVRHANLHALLDYHPGPYGGHITYFRTMGSERGGATVGAVDFWGALAGGGISVARVSGNHGTLLHEPHVRTLAAELLARTAPARDREG